MFGRRFSIVVILVMPMAMARAAPATHPCDPLDPVADVGWSVMPSVETISKTESAPYQTGGDWFVDRATTVLPFCNYFNETGNYSMRSYRLSPEVVQERIGICRRDGQGASVPVAPFTGPCPPK